MTKPAQPDAPDGEEAPRFFIFGCGYSGSAFANTFDPASIAGVTTRSPEKAARFRDDGLPAFLFDGDAPGEGIDEALADVTHLVLSVAPGPSGDPVWHHHGGAIARGMPRLRWIGYLSTVGVYGDHGGAWVDEASPTRPVSARSRERLEAEEAWTKLAQERETPLAILRLSGIYGPGRNAFENLRSGRARRLVKPGQVFNRIHVDDIAGALGFLSGRCEGGIFNVTDDEPAPPQDVVAYAARIGGFSLPPEVDFETADLSPMARSFYGENKRVANSKLKALGYGMFFRNFREGLDALNAP
ncbi:SDR family oxidoreductase [Aureimonas sp. ME7]|uniref:SDR family oxidoreductase n=1 Tax=Aureimonas sp. ME7 TaxID=2744252 RepID=UPI0015F8DBBA|nr:SDR family oxidoreductase [Aureimonas sp. ME7]